MAIAVQAGGEMVRGILSRELRAHGLAARLPRRVSPHVWESAVGKQIAARAQPTVLAAGTLHLLVQDRHWRDQLDAARNFLLERLNRELGAGSVRALQFGLAHHGALDEARQRAGLKGGGAGFAGDGRSAQARSIGGGQPPERTLEPTRVIGEARLPPVLREALLRAAEAQARRYG